MAVSETPLLDSFSLSLSMTAPFDVFRCVDCFD